MKQNTVPTTQLKKELTRENKRAEYFKMLRSTIYILLAVAAIAVLIATIWLPVLEVTGTSMEPTLEDGQIVVAIKNSHFEQGDVVAFYYNNKVLLKRVIGTAGDRIVIKNDGTVFVNGEELNEPYLKEKSRGQCDIDFPYQVPDGKIFVMGDHRSTSVDSRSNAVGCVAKEFIVGRVALRVWPLNDLSIMSSL